MTTTKTKDDFARSLAAEMGLSMEDARHAVDHFLTDFQRELVQGNTILFRGICSLKAVQRAAKVGNNPQNIEDGPYLIPPKRVIKFSVGSQFDEALNPDKP